MKVYINRKPVSGPWGGGNKTITALSNALRLLGHEVVYELDHPDIDVIYCHDPRPNNRGEWYQNFINHRNAHSSKIIQRVGDVGSHGKPHLLDLVRKTAVLSDFVIFPSEWSKERVGFFKENYEIIHNAPLRDFYKYRNQKDINERKIVTHHWSTNPKKGFEFYRVLDEYIGHNPSVSFTYIGSLPEGLNLKNTNIIPPTGDNDKIARILAENTVYLTASEEEAGANHVLEGLAAGLPVVYHENGGSIKNYCEKYGVSFNNFHSMIIALENIDKNYILFKERVGQFNNTIELVIEKYVGIICGVK